MANTYTGATAVQNGTLALGDAAALGTSTVTVAAGATLDLAGLNVTGATLLLNGGTIANASAYTGSVGFAAVITSFGAADLTSLDANVAVRVAAGQTLDTDTLTRAIDFRGGSLANLGTYAGVLNVKGALDAAATGWKGLNAALALSAKARAAASELPAPLAEARQRFAAAMDDDLNTSAALAVLFELAKPLRSLANRLERGDAAAAAEAEDADRKSTRLNSSHEIPSRMPSSA